MKKEITFAQLKKFICESKWDNPAYWDAIERNERWRREEAERRKTKEQKDWELKHGILWRTITDLGLESEPGRETMHEYIKAHIEEGLRRQCKKENQPPEVAEDIIQNLKKYCQLSSFDYQIEHTLDYMDL